MAYALKQFKATDLTTSYTSDALKFETRGNRTGIFQVDCNAGDSAVLQARLSSDFHWIDIVTVSDSAGLQEVVLAPQFRVVVTNTSGQEVLGAIHV